MATSRVVRGGIEHASAAEGDVQTLVTNDQLITMPDRERGIANQIDQRAFAWCYSPFVQ